MKMENYIYIRECASTLYDRYSSDANTKVYGDDSAVFKIFFLKVEMG